MCKLTEAYQKTLTDNAARAVVLDTAQVGMHLAQQLATLTILDVQFAPAVAGDFPGDPAYFGDYTQLKLAVYSGDYQFRIGIASPDKGVNIIGYQAEVRTGDQSYEPNTIGTTPGAFHVTRHFTVTERDTEDTLIRDAIAAIWDDLETDLIQWLTDKQLAEQALTN